MDFLSPKMDFLAESGQFGSGEKGFYGLAQLLPIDWCKRKVRVEATH